MKIDLPFRPRFKEPLLTGHKTMTCRTEKQGAVGDYFVIFGATFELTHVMRMRLGYVGNDCFAQEGCRSVQDFMEVWTSIHPTKGFDEDHIVWAHCFRRVEYTP